MEFNEKKQTLTIYGKEEKVSTLARKFASLSGKQFYDFFSNRAIGLPRTINCMALTSILNERLKTLTASEVTKDQAVRLQSYDKFSESELYDLFVSLCTTKDYYRKYRIALFTLILLNYNNLKLTDGEITYLNNVQNLPIEKVATYEQYITSASYEMVNTFDGQDMFCLEEGLNKSGVIANVIDLAEKYGINLAQKYTKDELVEEIKNYLKIKNAYTLDIESEIENSTIADLNLFCSKRNIPLASNMNKDNLIKYFFFIINHASIDTTSVTSIYIPDEFKPLQFRVDLSAYKGFKNEVTDATKQIIIWDNMAQAEAANEAVEEAEEVEEEAPAEEEQPVEEEAEEETKEAIEEQVEETEEAIEEPMELEPEEHVQYVDEDGNPVDEDGNPLEEQVEYVDEDGNPVDPEDVQEAEEEPQEEPVEQLAEAEAIEEAIEEPEEEKVVEEKQQLDKKEVEKAKKERLAHSFGDVEESNLYGDESLYKALKPPVKLIASLIGVALVVAAVIILIVAYI